MAYTTIDDPSAHFQATIFAGNETARTITFGGNSDLQMDLLWAKERDSAVNWHRVIDTTRGASTSSSPEIYSNADSDETPQAGGEHVKVIGSNSVQIGTAQGVNTASSGMVWWVWRANGGSRTTNAEDGNNPAGGYQANTTAGFSIVDYVGTGAAGTMAHGLGAVPSLIIIKNRDEADSGMVYHKHMTAAPETDYMVLDTTANPTDNADRWNDTAPTSSVFTIATDHSVNADGENYIAYLWTPIQGYSKFGGPYTGNGDEDGPFHYTGFKPAYVVTKLLDTDVHHWTVYQTDGVGYNKDATKSLYWNTDYAEVDGTSGSGRMDFLSNGFKLRHTSFDGNWDGATYIWMAFAHQPFVTSGGVPCTAR